MTGGQAAVAAEPLDSEVHAAGLLVFRAAPAGDRSGRGGPAPSADSCSASGHVPSGEADSGGPRQHQRNKTASTPVGQRLLPCAPVVSFFVVLTELHGVRALLDRAAASQVRSRPTLHLFYALGSGQFSSWPRTAAKLCPHLRCIATCRCTQRRLPFQLKT